MMVTIAVKSDSSNNGDWSEFASTRIGEHVHPEDRKVHLLKDNMLRNLGIGQSVVNFAAAIFNDPNSVHNAINVGLIAAGT